MPIADWNDPAVWNALYSCELNGQTLNYVRAAKERILGNDHWALKTALNRQPGQKIVLIGAGYGWIAEDWFASGLSPIVAVDTSTYIQNNKVGNATYTILNEDVSSNNGKRNIRTALGGSNVNADWIITEDVLPMLTDSECVQLATALRSFSTNVAHWVTVDCPGKVAWPPQNWKTLAAWKTLMSPDKIVQRGSNVIA